ncbi:hypothetical protein GX50_07566 [[Emmonsia] crescens]|uniref:Amino acid permease/ SLC12A domain-containing protein n=1 Tax=[Emmonsia] crescens TaxID=73230 RepID=A0A2B7Z8J0_9EURO|nr:hypothetical protein GX50_07566 [Emmonsia crescens]
MGRIGKAPRPLGLTNKAGVPWVALLFSNGFSCIAFISVSSNAGKLYEALITLSGVATFIVWSAIGITHIRFRQALVAQGKSPSTLPFKAAFYPYGTYFSLGANVFFIFFQGYPAFLNPFNAENFVVNYILLPIFLSFVVFWKWYKKTKWVKLEEMGIWSGRRDYGEEELNVKKRTMVARLDALSSMNGSIWCNKNIPGIRPHSDPLKIDQGQNWAKGRSKRNWTPENLNTQDVNRELKLRDRMKKE